MQTLINSKRRYLIVSVLILYSNVPANGFFTSRSLNGIKHHTILLINRNPKSRTAQFYSSENKNGSNEEGSFHLEETRKQLESLVTEDESNNSSFSSSTKRLSYAQSPVFRLPSGSLASNFDDYEIPVQTPITTIERERKQLEINLLQELKHGNEVIPKLWDLWYRERGSKAATKLYEADELIGQGVSGFAKAEMILLELLNEHGIHWVEPSNRLATLYFVEGKLQASEAICLVVLSVKPWHFGAINGLAMIHTLKGQERSQSRSILSQLPPVVSTDPYDPRTEWVNKAVEEAKLRLRNAEELLHNSFGKQDRHAINKEGPDHFELEEASPWQ